jgi:hypothetical protein
LLDALSYIDQVSLADFAHTIDVEDDWIPEDEIAGY